MHLLFADVAVINRAWVDNELCQLQTEKLKAHRKAKRTRGAENWSTFRHLRNKGNSLCRSKHKLFIQNFGKEVNSNPKKFWSYVKSKTGNRVIPSDMIYKDVKLSTPDAQASSFNKHFHSPFSNPVKLMLLVMTIILTHTQTVIT